MHKGLDALSERDRRMVLLLFFADKTQTQIVEEMSISLMHVSRTLGILRRTMNAA